jgi:hypothetical protein
MTMESIGVAAAILGLIVLVGRVVYPPYKAMKNFFTWMEKFRRDWEGEESEPGRDRTPGVMERLNRLDGELSNNGGSSLKDAVCRIETTLSVIEEKMGPKKNGVQRSVSNKRPRKLG